MNDDKGVLRRSHAKMSEDIIVDEVLLANSIQSGILELGMIEAIRAPLTNIEKVQKLLEILPKRCPKALTKFISVLKTINPCLATLLLDAMDTAQRTKTPNYSNASYVGNKPGLQIQEERNRYQRILRSSNESFTPTLSHRPDEVFAGSGVTEKLFSLHCKMEPYILRYDIEELRPDDDYGHSEQRRNPHETGSRRQVPQLLPKDIDFDLVHKELDIILGQVESMNAQFTDCYRYFDQTDKSQYALSKLIGRTVGRCKTLENEASQDRKQISSLLDERESQLGEIHRLQSERTEHRKQIQAAFLDMASLRQERTDLSSKIKDLEVTIGTIRQQLQNPAQPTQKKKTSNNNNLQVMNKTAKPSPRGKGALGQHHT